jgi:hypothetical protein
MSIDAAFPSRRGGTPCHAADCATSGGAGGGEQFFSEVDGVVDCDGRAPQMLATARHTPFRSLAALAACRHARVEAR